MNKTLLRTISLIMAFALTFGTFISGQAKRSLVGSFTNSSQTTSSTAPYTGYGMWISPSQLMSLPTSGAAWDKIRTAAYGSWGTADLKDVNNKHAIYTLAGALVYARTGDEALRAKVRDGILAAKRSLDEYIEWQTVDGVLATGRQLGAYVISADLINLPNYDAAARDEFGAWLWPVRTTNIGTHGRWKNLRYTCENSTGNWNTFACASRIAASIYLGDTADVQRSALIIRALLGERSAYPSDAPGENGYFEHTNAYQSSWACDDPNWTGDNPTCAKSGVNADGVLVEDASRGGGCCVLQGDGVMYSWEALQGLFVSAELLYRTGSYGNPYAWSNNALKRSLDFMQRSGWAVTPPATSVPWLANTRYGTSYPTSTGGNGRIMSWGDWLYSTATTSTSTGTITNVSIGGTTLGNYSLSVSESQSVKYEGINGGPLKVVSTTGLPIIAALRDLWSDGTTWSSSVQLMGLPASQLSDKYVFPSYNNVALSDQLRFANVGNSATTVTVIIGGATRGTYNLNPNDSQRVSYPGLDSGPVIVKSSNGVPIIASIRDAWSDGNRTSSFAQLMGLPAIQLSDTYYFPTYNNINLNDQIHFGNVGTSSTTVTITIGGVPRGSYSVKPNESKRISYDGVDSGPVIVQSSGKIPIVASIRDAWSDGSTTSSYVQLMGLPASQLSTTYFFPVYDNANVNAQLRFGNVGNAQTTITVTVAGVVRGIYNLGPMQNYKVWYPGLNAGPVIVQSSTTPIIVSIRDALWDGSRTSSYSQLMGLPAGQLSNTYVFPAYNNVTYDNELRIAVP